MFVGLLLLLLTLWRTPGAAAEPNAADSNEAEPLILTIHPTPLLGRHLEQGRVPGNIQSFQAREFDEADPLNLADMLNRRAGNLIINEAQNNPFQPDILYRGFTASPLLGLPQGIAFYQNGIRVNEAFGDTVQFDLIPEFAIDDVQLHPGTNPAFGLNALGGAVTIRTKTGFSFEGARSEISGGSFGRVQGTQEYGVNIDNFALYAGGTGFRERGWRKHSPSKLGQVFGDLSMRSENVDITTNYMFARTSLTGNGAAPVELLDADRSAVFTFPDLTENSLDFLTVHGEARVSDTLSFQGNSYYRRVVRDTLNGDETDIEECEDDATLLCTEDGEGERVRDLSGAPLATSLAGEEPFAVFNRSKTETTGYGGALQASIDAPILDFANRFIFGSAIDFGHTDYRATTELGGLTPDRTIDAHGILLSNDVFSTDLLARNRYIGVYFTDDLSLTERLDLTVSGRFNYAFIELDDQAGTALTGEHDFTRFNPAMGLTYRLARNLAVYTSYGEANRAPTAAELSCANPDRPCRVPNAFVSDPPLAQVVSRTAEAGMRGQTRALGKRLRLDWTAALFGARNQDDIVFVSAGATRGSGFFRNIGLTQRLGAEFGLKSRYGPFEGYMNYGFVRATFEESFTVRSPSNPAADPNGEIVVGHGDRIPGIPLHSAKLGVSMDVTDRWRVAFETLIASDQFLRGDESNEQAPVDGYAIVNLRSAFRVNNNFELFAHINNLFDTDYETFGTFGETSEVFLSEVPGGGTNPRFLAPGAPLGLWGGLRATF
jgi:outer membrane receptor protein involved in Fe transport